MVSALHIKPFNELGFITARVGPLLQILIFSPEAMEAAMNSNKMLNKGQVYDYLATFLKEGLITSKQEKWKIHRKILTPTFHFRILEEFVPVMNKQAKRLLESFESQIIVNDGVIKDLAKPILLCALDTICGNVFIRVPQIAEILIAAFEIHRDCHGH